MDSILLASHGLRTLGLRSRFARRARWARPRSRLRALRVGQVRSLGAQKEGSMLKVAELSFQLIEELRPLVVEIKRRDRSLADQLMRAVSSIALNLAEGELSEGGIQRSRFFTAAGSANESRAALRVAVGWRHITPEAAAPARERLGHIIAILWKLTHR